MRFVGVGQQGVQRPSSTGYGRQPAVLP